jgi:peptidoglycan/LPS O-acetylase OafA/YrhL
MQTGRDQRSDRTTDAMTLGGEHGVAGRRAFDDVRLVAAAGVVLSHSYHLTGSIDPATTVIGFGNLGTVCVIAFMALSGYLVTQSWEHDGRLGAFFVKRALRIMPALVVVVIATTLVIGPLVTSESLGAYMRDPGTWKYLINNAAVHPDPTALPGVFSTNPEAIANASLWTLPYEVTFYLTVPVLLIAASSARRRLTLILGLATVAALAIAGMRDMSLVWTMRTGWLSLFAIAFLTGALLRSLSGRAVAAAGVLVCAVAVTTMGSSLWPVTCTLMVATLAVAVGSIRTGFVRRRFHGDLSYGLYLWGYPVQQLIVALSPVRQPFALFAIALPLTALCAAASWRLVESPALQLKARLRQRRDLRPTVAEITEPHPHQNAAAMIT